MPNGFIFYETYYEAFSELPDEDRLRVYDALIAYGLYGEATDLPKRLRPYMALIRPGMDSAKRRYAASVENGKKGGAPKGNKNARRKTGNNAEQLENDLGNKVADGAENACTNADSRQKDHVRNVEDHERGLPLKMPARKMPEPYTPPSADEFNAMRRKAEEKLRAWNG